MSVNHRTCGIFKLFDSRAAAQQRLRERQWRWLAESPEGFSRDTSIFSGSELITLQRRYRWVIETQTSARPSLISGAVRDFTDSYLHFYGFLFLTDTDLSVHGVYYWKLALLSLLVAQGFVYHSHLTVFVAQFLSSFHVKSTPSLVHSSLNEITWNLFNLSWCCYSLDVNVTAVSSHQSRLMEAVIGFLYA